MGRQHRLQSDDDQDLLSYESGLDCSGFEDLTRQEFKDEVDINTIIRRFPIVPQIHERGEADYTTTLHDVFIQGERLRERYELLPKAVRARYKNWFEVMDAAVRGDITNADLADASEEAREAAVKQAQPSSVNSEAQSAS